MSQFPVAEPVETTLNCLAEALDQVDIGILLLDGDLRVRFLNRRQSEIFGLPSTVLAAGTTFRDLLNHGVAKGVVALATADLPAYLDRSEAAVRAGPVPPIHIDFMDGSRLLFDCKACADGRRILTYTDVSKQLRPEALDAMALINAELRFNNETMEDHAAQLASLAEATDESIQKVQVAKQELEREIIERRLLEAQLRRLATTDVLTGALNRAGFLALGQAEVERASLSELGLALMMLDVDHFKSINDRYGHAGGDLALKHLVAVLSGRIRQSDLLGRLGGEEFAILLPAMAPDAAERMAERLVAMVAESPVMFCDRLISMTVSIGLTVMTTEDHSVEQIIGRADNALYQAKGSGRNRVVTDRHAEVA